MLQNPIFDTLISERRSWLIYEGVSVSDPDVPGTVTTIMNVQWMIEEIFERRMDQEEEYMQEHRALLQQQL